MIRVTRHGSVPKETLALSDWFCRFDSLTPGQMRLILALWKVRRMRLLFDWLPRDLVERRKEPPCDDVRLTPPPQFDPVAMTTVDEGDERVTTPLRHVWSGTEVADQQLDEIHPGHYIVEEGGRKYGVSIHLTSELPGEWTTARRCVFTPPRHPLTVWVPPPQRQRRERRPRTSKRPSR